MIKVFAMDVDGTLTDGKINIAANGELFKSFNVKDGYGIKLLMKNNIVPVIITGRNSEIVLNRTKELGMEYIYQGISDKTSVLSDICMKFNIKEEEIAYIGDDLNDLDIINRVGYSFAPSDAVKQIKSAVKYICESKGGEGAVREAIDFILGNYEEEI